MDRIGRDGGDISFHPFHYQMKVFRHKGKQTFRSGSSRTLLADRSYPSCLPLNPRLCNVLPTKYSEQTKSVGLGSTHWRILEEVVSKGGVIVQNIVFIVNGKKFIL